MRYHFFKTKGKRKQYIADGIRFGSAGELERYEELKAKQMAGLIQALECHPKFVLIPEFVDAMGQKHRAVLFTPDFRYFDASLGKIVVEEYKTVISYRTKKNKVLKKKLLVNDAYPLRRTLFLKHCLKPDMIYLEPELN